MGCGIKTEFDRLNYKASTKLVFFYLRDIAASNEDGRAVAGREWLAEAIGVGEQTIRTALKQLQADGLISIYPQSGRRKAAIITINHRRANQQSNQQTNQLISTKTRRELSATNQQSNQQTNQTGVTAVSRSSDVDVSPALSVSVRATTARATPSVDKSEKKAPEPPRRRRQEDYDSAIARAPRLGEVWMYLDQLSAELTGHKYPWSQHPYAATILADLLCAYGQPVVLAAAEKFFQRGDPWIERRGWAIEEFGKLFAGLLAKDGINKRAAKIEADLKHSARPTSPKELRAQLDAMRRRQIEAMTAKPEPDPLKELSVV